MSSRGFLLRIPDDDSFDNTDILALSPTIVLSRSEYFDEGGKTIDFESTLNFKSSHTRQTTRVFFALSYKTFICKYFDFPIFLKIDLKILDQRSCVGELFFSPLCIQFCILKKKRKKSFDFVVG